ncbi:MAG: MBL fold metallo-hydrolase [Myxococcota bacterium]
MRTSWLSGMLLAGLIVAGLGCTSTTPIEDGSNLGGVITLSDEFVAAFVYATDDGAILFDTGGDEQGSNVLAGLAQQGLSAADVTDVFLTHGHGDHCAGMLLFPQARIWGFEQDLPLLQAEGPAGAQLSGLLADGQRVQTGAGVEVEALLTPGHTPGNAVFVVERVVVMGDTAVANTDGSISPPPSFFSEDPAQATQALSDLALRLEPRAATLEGMVFGHSGPVETLDALLEWL